MKMRWVSFFAIVLSAVAQESTPVIRAEVNVVTVTFAAADANGAPIRDLRRDELKLIDDQRLREIAFFSHESGLPFTIGLIVDMSNSQRQYFEQHRVDVKEFLKRVLQPGDRAFLMSFGPQRRIDVVTELTGSSEELSRGVDALEQCHPSFGNRACSSPMWGAVVTAARTRLAKATGRKALILLADGADIGDTSSLSDAIEAAQGADAPVYTLMSRAQGVNPVSQAINPFSLLRTRPFEVRMRRLAEETGGRYYDTSKQDAVSIFSQIEEDLRNLYVVGFSVPESERDGKFHKLKLEATRPDVRIRAREGYTAAQQ